MWWKTYRWPTVCLSSVFPLRLSTSLTSLISTEETHRSSSSPTGTLSISPHQSGAPPFTRISFVLTIRSGCPAIQVSLLGNTLGGGMSAGSPSGIPFSTHAAIAATSQSLSDGSFLKCWIPMSFSTYQGGIAPAT